MEKTTLIDPFLCSEDGCTALVAEIPSADLDRYRYHHNDSKFSYQEVRREQLTPEERVALLGEA